MQYKSSFDLLGPDNPEYTKSHKKNGDDYKNLVDIIKELAEEKKIDLDKSPIVSGFIEQQQEQKKPKIRPEYQKFYEDLQAMKTNKNKLKEELAKNIQPFEKVVEEIKKNSEIPKNTIQEINLGLSKEEMILVENTGLEGELRDEYIQCLLKKKNQLKDYQEYDKIFSYNNVKKVNQQKVEKNHKDSIQSFVNEIKGVPDKNKVNRVLEYLGYENKQNYLSDHIEKKIDEKLQSFENRILNKISDLLDKKLESFISDKLDKIIEEKIENVFKKKNIEFYKNENFETKLQENENTLTELRKNENEEKTFHNYINIPYSDEMIRMSYYSFYVLANILKQIFYYRKTEDYMNAKSINLSRSSFAKNIRVLLAFGIIKQNGNNTYQMGDIIDAKTKRIPVSFFENLEKFKKNKSTLRIYFYYIVNLDVYKNTIYEIDKKNLLEKFNISERALQRHNKIINEITNLRVMLKNNKIIITNKE